MRKLLLASLFIFLVPVIALAQDNNRVTQGYAFWGLGDSYGTSAMHFGGGGEFDFYKGIGFAIDVGYMAPTRHLGSGIGILSPNGRYAFRRSADSKLVPYVPAGYSLLFPPDTVNAFNFGGGIDYWFANRYGLKVEFRDHILTDCSYDCHAYQIRTGLSFR